MKENSISLSGKQVDFAGTVKQTFSFLIQDYGMECTAERKNSFIKVCYASKDVFLYVHFDTYSYELGLEVGLLSVGSKESCFYSLAEVLEVVLGKDHEYTTFCQSSTKDGVEEYIKHFSEIVKNHYEPALQNRKDFFECLALAKSASAELSMRNLRLQDVRKEAAEAWDNKDYSRLVELYEPIRSELTNAELKKLDYALKQKQL